MEAGVIGLGALAVVAAVRGWGVVRRTPLDARPRVVLRDARRLDARERAAARGDRLVAGLGRPRLLRVFWWLRDVGHAARLARLVVLAGLVAAAYGIVQHFTGADVYRALLGRQTFVRPASPA
jgi:hypothetical protein